MSVRNPPRIEGYIGASGSGKGVSIARRLAELRPARLLIWDPRNEYDKHAGAVTSLPALVQAFRRAGPGGAVKARYVPGASVPMADAFGLLCALAFEAGDLVFVAEELSDVTTASYAPPAWRRCITQGRHKALHVIGATQRPALIDKTFLANCSRLRCFTLNYADDRRTVARDLDVTEAAVAQLSTEEAPGGVLIRYIERDRRERTVIAGEISIKGGRISERKHPFAQGAT